MKPGLLESRWLDIRAAVSFLFCLPSCLHFSCSFTSVRREVDAMAEQESVCVLRRRLTFQQVGKPLKSACSEEMCSESKPADEGFCLSQWRWWWDASRLLASLSLCVSLLTFCMSLPSLTSLWDLLWDLLFFFFFFPSSSLLSLQISSFQMFSFRSILPAVLSLSYLPLLPLCLTLSLSLVG